MKEYSTHRIKEIDCLRAIAIILVIIGHCGMPGESQFGDIYWSPAFKGSYASEFLEALVVFIYSFHMPLFFMISGWVFGITYCRRRSETEFMQFVSKKFHRLIIPFVLVALLYSLPIKYFMGVWQGDLSQRYMQILNDELFMVNYSYTHLWFLPTLFMIFMAAYVIERTNWRKQPLFLFVLLFVLQYFAHLFSWHMWVYRTAYYLFWFYLGVGWADIHKNINSYLNSGRRIAAVFAVSTICEVLVYVSICTFENAYYHLVARVINVLLMSFTLYILSKAMVRIKLLQRLAEYFSSKSYDLYLYSQPVNYIIVGTVASIAAITNSESGAMAVGIFSFRAVMTTVVPLLVAGCLQALKRKRPTPSVCEN